MPSSSSGARKLPRFFIEYNIEILGLILEMFRYQSVLNSQSQKNPQSKDFLHVFSIELLHFLKEYFN